MKNSKLITLLAAALLSTAASAQERAAEKTLTIADVNGHFQRGDKDGSGKLSRFEARALGVTLQQAGKYDYNGDTQLDAIEFAVAYKELALSRGVKIAPGLTKHVQREVDRRRLEAKKTSDAKRAKEARDAVTKRKETAEAKENAEKRDAAEKRAAADKRKRAAEAAKKRAEAEARRKRGGAKIPK